MQKMIRTTLAFSAMFAVSMPLTQAADIAKEADTKRVTLMLFSDMVQDATTLNFASGPIPTLPWVQGQAKKELLPQLAGMCVSVVGVDVSTPRGAAIRSSGLPVKRAKRGASRSAAV